MSTHEPYLQPHQARKRPNTQFEELCPLTSGEWTEDAYKTLMARLGE